MKKKILAFVAALAVVMGMGFVAEAAEVSPMEVSGATTVDTAAAMKLFSDGVVFVDVRRGSDWDNGRIPGAVHLDQKKNWNETVLAEAVAKDQPLVIYCNGESCLRSSQCSADAVSWGFTKVYYYRDGFPAWRDAGHPVE